MPAAESFGTANDGIVGWFEYPANHPNTGGSISDVTRNMAREISIAASDYVDYAAFDRDGNVIVDWMFSYCFTSNNGNGAGDGSIEPHELHIIQIWAGYEGR